jgi:uncharacterized protein (DUF302 family)
MNYCFSKTLEGKSFEEAIEAITIELKKEGFGILNEIDLQATLKSKIDVDFKKYKILGACNPHFAHKALLAEDKIGLFLPCNVIVEEHENGTVEVSAIDPMASMSSVKNETLASLAAEVQTKLKAVIDNLK